MMDKDAVRTRVEGIGIIPSVRVSSAADARFAAEAVSVAGIPIVEITMTVPGALAVIADLVAAMPDLVVGAGTVLDVETARQCVEAGAGFITSPGLDVGVVEYAVKQGVLALPGVLTPTDVMAARNAHADFVKVFPCGAVGGPAYVRALSAPFPKVRIVAAGGVNQQTAAEFIAAGATAVGVGAELIPKKAIHERDRRWITELAHRFLNIVEEARGAVREDDRRR
jgi:2-dehydro-3-deoxyphosphogluconate aldolase/(4S)-4-hydroxy-2-oxoglutarate aldolase